LSSCFDTQRKIVLSTKKMHWHILLMLLLPLGILPAQAAWLLVPMDETQTDHLRAYGLTYLMLERGQRVEWLLNYRFGSFLTEKSDMVSDQALLLGVKIENKSASDVAAIRQEMAAGNMEAVLLETAPKIAVYCPSTAEPWDDAVRLALEYARIPYDVIWDREVLGGVLEDYDWLHLHHEDFTGQFGKFYASFSSATWYLDRKQRYESEAATAGFGKVSEHKSAVALSIKRYVEKGGFLFAMCSATDTIDIALAALGTDIVDTAFDGDPPDTDCQAELDFSMTFAFTGFRVITSPRVYEFSDLDTTPNRKAVTHPLDHFKLFDFAARFDPVPCMLTQCHSRFVKGFMGQTTGFRKRFLKPDVLLMVNTLHINETKYLPVHLGRSTFTFLGGHDPEDYQHLVGDPPTELGLNRNSPGYRLILNNVLFPAARKQERKT